MVIIIESGLYPDLERIRASIVSGQKPRKDIDYNAYLSVYFCVQNVYFPLSALALYYTNEATFDHLLFMPNFDPSVTELHQSGSLLRIALERIYHSSSDDKAKYTKMFNSLLKNRRLDFGLGILLNHQTPFHYVAAKGDRDLSLFRKIAEQSEFSPDLHGATPLFLSLQEAQYQTTQYLLTKFGKSMFMTRRVDGRYPLDIACQYSTDLAQGLPLIAQMLSEFDSDFFSNSEVLFSVLLNENHECKVAFLNMLLAKGANPNTLNSQGDYLLNLLAAELSKETDTEKTENWLQILDILLQHGANVFFKIKRNQNDYITEMTQCPNGRQIIRRINEHFKTDNSALLRIHHLISGALSEKNTDDKKQIDFDKKMHAIHQLPNEKDRGLALLRLKADLADDWATTPANSLAEFRKKAILSRLIDLYNRGYLSAEGIFEVIKIFRGMPEGIYKNALPYLYRSYLATSLMNFPASTNKSRTITSVLMMATQFFSSFEQQPDEDCLFFINELNDIIQRVILLALSDAKNNYQVYETCLSWLSKIPVDCFDRQTQLLILELKITQAYFQNKHQEFNQFFAQFPSNHILHRQYLYWQVTLLFKQNISELTVEHVNELNRALANLKNKYPDIPVSYTNEFSDKLAEYRRKIASDAKSQKPAKKRPDPLPTIIVQPPALPPIFAPSISNSNSNAASSSSSSSSLMLNQTKAIVVSDPIDPVVKAKRRHQYVEGNVDVMTNLAQQNNPYKKQALYTEEQIREKFQTVLKEGDILKPLTYSNEEGICWAVCRAHDAVYDKLAVKFMNKFAECYEVKMGHANSGISCEKDVKETKEDNGVIRLKLGGHDERLQGPIYRLEEVEGQPKDRCFLIVFENRWVHGDAFKQQEIILKQPKPANSNNNANAKVMKKSGCK